jgi:adenylate kinase
MSLNLFIIGPSGCGKSTQAKMIAEKYNLTHFSMGQLLRDEMASKTELGLKAQAYVDAGTWAPDELVLDILKFNLNKVNNQNFIVDGFPRMVNQGIKIENYLETSGYKMSALILLDVTFEEIMARRQKLGLDFQDSSRTDNTPEVIAQRQKSYDESIAPIIEHYQSENRLIQVDGNRPIEPIFEDICQKVNSLPKN